MPDKVSSEVVKGIREQEQQMKNEIEESKKHPDLSIGMVALILRTMHFDDKAKALEDWLAARLDFTDEQTAGADSPSPRGECG